MRRTRARHVGMSVASGATTPNRSGLVMRGLLSEGQMSGRIPRAPGGPVDVDRHTAQGGLRSDQFERPLPAGLGNSRVPWPTTTGNVNRGDLIDKVVLQQPPEQRAAAVHLQLAARLGFQLGD